MTDLELLKASGWLEWETLDPMGDREHREGMKELRKQKQALLAALAAARAEGKADGLSMFQTSAMELIAKAKSEQHAECVRLLRKWFLRAADWLEEHKP